MQIDFPHVNGLWVRGSSATVRGSASDDSEIISVAVNGVEAETSDGFETWQVTIPIESAESDGARVSLSLTADDIHGNRQTVENNRWLRTYAYSHWYSGVSSELDKAGGRIFNYAAELVETDLETGAQKFVHDISGAPGTFMYSAATGAHYQKRETEIYQLVPGDSEYVVVSQNGQSGEYFSFITRTITDDSDPIVYALAYPPGGSEDYERSLYSIDLLTGEREMISGPHRGEGPSIEPFDLMDASNGRLFLASSEFEEPVQQILEVDLATGNRSVISSAEKGSGYALNLTQDFVVDALAEKAYIADFENALIEIDIASGDRRLVSGPEAAYFSNLVFEQGNDIEVDQGRGFVYISSRETAKVIAIDIRTGERTSVVPSRRGDGPGANMIRSIAYDSVRDKIVIGNQVVQTQSPQIMLVDPVTGDRSILSGPGMDDGVETTTYIGTLKIDMLSGDIYTLDSLFGEIVRIDRETGHRSILFRSEEASDPRLTKPGSMAIDSDSRTLYITDGATNALLATDLSLEEIRVVSQPSMVGQGTGWEEIGFIELDLSRDMAYVGDSTTHTIFRVDLATGDREVLTGGNVGTGPALEALGQLILDPQRNRLFIAQSPSYAPIVSVDLETGDREFRYFSGTIYWSPVKAIDTRRGWMYMTDHGQLINVYDYDTTQALTLSY